MLARAISAILIGCWLFTCPPASAGNSKAPAKYAILIGIGKYQHTDADLTRLIANVPQLGRYTPALTYQDLAGPVNDVGSMQKVLVAKFHFSSDPAYMRVLLNEQATHDAIMQAMQHYMVDLPKKGDIVVLYVSSHGSLRIYPKNQGNGELYALLGDPSDERHAENTIVPYDWYTGVNDIFSRDLRHFYREAVAKGIQVTAIFDSCHSGDLGRGLLGAGLVPRDFDFDPRPMPPDPYAREEDATLPQDDPLDPVLILSAAQRDQLAIDDETAQKPHGVFTKALVDALDGLQADRPVSDIFSRLRVSMELEPNSIHQQPEMDTSQERQRKPIFGGEAATGATTAAVVDVGSDGVLLDIGIVADVGPGSIFTALPGEGNAPVKLQVIKSVGIGRSLARIQPPGGTIRAKDIVQLEAAVPWQRPDLLVYAGTSNPSLVDLRDAVAAVSDAHLSLDVDPSRDPWSYHLYWDEAHWELSEDSQFVAGKRSNPKPSVDMGLKLSAKALHRIPVGSVVWFDPPLAQEMVRDLLPPPTGDALPIAAHLTGDRSKATYVIGAKLNGDSVSYAWFKRSDVDSEMQTPAWMGAGCSPGSAYPLHTEWIDEATSDATAAALNKYALNLAKLNGWFLLQSSPLSKHVQFPYKLALRPASGGADVGENGTTYVGDYELYLTGDPMADVTPQWVYVMSFDCQGNGSVVWPYDAPPEKVSQPPRMFPVDDKNKRLPEIKLPGYPFPVQPPLGTDTYILLTTSTPLSNYHALAFDRLVSKGVTDNPLEELLDDTSGGTRSPRGPIPANWSVWVMQVESRPAPSQQ